MENLMDYIAGGAREENSERWNSQDVMYAKVEAIYRATEEKGWQLRGHHSVKISL